MHSFGAVLVFGAGRGIVRTEFIIQRQFQGESQSPATVAVATDYKYQLGNGAGGSATTSSQATAGTDPEIRPTGNKVEEKSPPC